MGLIVIALFVVLFLIGIPIAFALALPGLIYVVWTGLPLSMVAHRMTYALDSFPLLAVPLFVLVGELMNTSGITVRIFRFAGTLVSHLSGGLAQVNIGASLIFSGTSGAALADVGGLGSMEIKAMKEAGYDGAFSAAVTAASATIGPIFPPSIPLIIYGAVAEVSSVHLLIAGITPALLTVASLMIMTAWIAHRWNVPKSEKMAPWSDVLHEFISALPALLTPVILIAGMMFGVFSPTEAAAVTVLYVLLVDAVVYKDLTWAHVLQSGAAAVKTTTTILLTVAAAALFGWILAVEQVPQSLSRTLLSLSKDPYVLLLITNVLLLIVGCFMETISALLLLTPLIVPPLLAVGVDPVHLGLVVVFNLMIGLLTPPMGMSLFLVADIAKEPVEKVLKALIPYYVPLLITLLLITYYPKFVLWIPSLLN